MIVLDQEAKTDNVQCLMGGMANVFEASLANTQRENLNCDEFLSVLVDAEHDDRSNRRIERNIRNARFRYKANIEELYDDVE